MIQLSILRNYLAITFFSFCGTISLFAQQSNRIIFTATPTGAEQTTPTSSAAFGVGTMALDPTFDTSCVQLAWGGLSSTLQGLHVHRGAVGTNGGVIVDLAGLTDNNRVTGQLPHSQLPTTWTKEMLEKGLYFNVHSANNTSGEIRGQLELASDYLFQAELAANNVVGGGGASGGGGLALIRVDKTKNKLSLALSCNDLGSNIEEVRVSFGQEGQQGLLLEEISSNFEVSTGYLYYEPATWSVADVVDSLKSNNFYIEITTTSHPNGAIRGDFKGITSGYFGVESSLDTVNQGGNVVLTGDYQGSGIGYCLVSPRIDTLYSIFYTNLTSVEADAVHYHELSTGNVIHNMSAGINGRWVRDTLTGKLAVTSILRKMLEGNCYVNVHTTAHPSGEIRGTMMKLPHDVYFADLTTTHLGLGASDAQGYVYLSTSIDSDEAELAFVCSNVTDSNLVVAIEDANGTVLDLTNNLVALPDGAYLKDTLTMSAAFRTALENGELFFSVRNDTFSTTGELLGNLSVATSCDGIFTNIELIEEQLPSCRIYPNPTQGILHIETDWSMMGNKQLYIQVLDARGVILREANMTTHLYDIDMQNYPNGFYFVRVLMGNNSQIYKVVKQ